ncbi:hypothetical protein DFA_10877 [Cavenderia fasciculata]|uniref:Uncharacterized protein n=1 Tax=Cavenderia fasciculata TaxID=261658 RepID=F4QBN1_CACFS|nr:uncharacterized protein DFA_10877 [Cavenderia fasciculata]EGG14619.1 hypothetical protein DFA_10877 [Cavenderia fasciculata]|eukprot:XP_004351127.1 hypothetical protein DFA_10877 [Cavenderia fasciculata]
MVYRIRNYDRIPSVLNVIIAGKEGVGKSSLVRSLTSHPISKETPADFTADEITFDGFSGIKYRLCLSDDVYDKDTYTADMVVAIYDVTDRSTLDHFSRFHFPSYSGRQRAFILVGNFDDKEGREVSYEDGMKQSSEWGCSLFFEIGSSSKNEFVSVMEKSFFHLLNQMYIKLRITAPSTPCNTIAKRFIIDEDPPHLNNLNNPNNNNKKKNQLQLKNNIINNISNINNNKDTNVIIMNDIIEKNSIRNNNSKDDITRLFKSIIRNKYVGSIVWRQVANIHRQLDVQARRFRDMTLLWIIHNKYFDLFDARFRKDMPWQLDQIEFICFLRSNTNYARYCLVTDEYPLLLQEYKFSALNDCFVNIYPNIDILQHIYQYGNNTFLSRFIDDYTAIIQAIQNENIELVRFYVEKLCRGSLPSITYNLCKAEAKALKSKEILTYLKDKSRDKKSKNTLLSLLKLKK